MGIVNITPDSFSDGGRFFNHRSAIEQALKLQEEGADLLDLGAESTRPGSEPVAASEQLNRLLPVLDGLRTRITSPISIDTSLAEVAAECLRKGASIINDVSGFHKDELLPEICAQHGAGVVLMHLRGTPKTMQQDPRYGDLIAEVKEYLREGIAAAEAAGIRREQVVVDPGLGFGKTFDQNYQLLSGLHSFADLAAGLLAGPSRKAFTGEFSGLPPDERQFSTAGAVAIAVLAGADVVRVHDVAEMRQVTDIVDRYREIHERHTG